MFSAQSATFKDLLREQRRTYDNALMTVMNELLVALEESEVNRRMSYFCLDSSQSQSLTNNDILMLVA